MVKDKVGARLPEAKVCLVSDPSKCVTSGHTGALRFTVEEPINIRSLAHFAGPKAEWKQGRLLLTSATRIPARIAWMDGMGRALSPARSMELVSGATAVVPPASARGLAFLRVDLPARGPWPMPFPAPPRSRSTETCPRPRIPSRTWWRPWPSDLASAGCADPAAGLPSDAWRKQTLAITDKEWQDRTEFEACTGDIFMALVRVQMGGDTASTVIKNTCKEGAVKDKAGDIAALTYGLKCDSIAVEVKFKGKTCLGTKYFGPGRECPDNFMLPFMACLAGMGFAGPGREGSL
jgi:hypothetical protein